MAAALEPLEHYNVRILRPGSLEKISGIQYTCFEKLLRICIILWNDSSKYLSQENSGVRQGQ